MRYVGLDVHLRQSTFCVLDGGGRKVMTRTVRGPAAEAVRELSKLPGSIAVCFEASSGYGALYERLRAVAKRVVVANPGQLRLIFRSKRKNDRVDAEKLAKLLYLEATPSIHVPRLEVRSWRRMIGHRLRLIHERTRVKNSMRALLRSQGIESPQGLWSLRGLAWLGGEEMTTDLDALQRDILLERIRSLDEMIHRVERALDHLARCHPGVRLLQTIPGVGSRTAEAVVAWIDDPQRFRKIRTIGSYFGLVPSQDASASMNRLGHITREGPAAVRSLLTEAAWQAVRRSPRVRAYYSRIRRDDPGRRKIALIATAHYLLRVMLAMLQTGEVWRVEPEVG